MFLAGEQPSPANSPGLRDRVRNATSDLISKRVAMHDKRRVEIVVDQDAYEQEGIWPRADHPRAIF